MLYIVNKYIVIRVFGCEFHQIPLKKLIIFINFERLAWISLMCPRKA